MSGLKNNWKLIVAAVGVLGLAYFMVFHWSRFLEDFWPLDASRISPNISASLVQYVLLAVLAYLLYPPFKRAVNAWSKKHVDALKEHISAEHDALHDKVDHMIKHIKAVPNQHKDGSDFIARPPRPSDDQATPQR